MNDIGDEGAVMFKADGRYYLGAADSYEGGYSTRMAVSDNVWGPYKMRFETVPSAGGGNFFQVKEGGWWATYMGNENTQPWQKFPGLIRRSYIDY